MSRSFCRTRHCPECRSILGLRGECKNRDCERSPLFRYRHVRGDVVFGAYRAALVRDFTKLVEEGGSP